MEIMNNSMEQNKPAEQKQPSQYDIIRAQLIKHFDGDVAYAESITREILWYG